MALAQIAFLGIGLMGQPMVARLLQADYPVTVWNRTQAKTQASVALGAVAADSIADAVSSADILITMLEAGNIVIEVVKQALPYMQKHAILIDMSSTRQSEAIELQRLLNQHDMSFIDAPVSGGVIGAQTGTLAIMVGASSSDFELVQPLLSAMGTATLVGLPGSGQVAKLCNQLIVGGTLNLVAEALLLAQAGGADPVAVRQALRGGFAESRILEVHGQRMLERNFIPGGQVKSQAKDMDNIMALADQVQLKLPQAELIAEAYRRQLLTTPHADQSAILLDLENSNQGIRLSQNSTHLPV